MMREWVYDALPSSRVNSSALLVCSNPRGRACRTNGKGSAEEEILSDVVLVYLYCPAFSVSVSLGVYPGMHAGRPPSHSAHLAPSAQAELSSGCGHGLEAAHQHGSRHHLLLLIKLITERHLISGEGILSAWVSAALPSSRENSSAPLVCRHDRVLSNGHRL